MTRRRDWRDADPCAAAALTSSISMLEVMVSRAEEREGVKRKWAAAAIGFAAFLAGLFTVWSFNLLEHVFLLKSIPSFEEKTLFNLIDYLVTNIMLPLGVMLYALFAGWWLSKDSTMKTLGLTGVRYTIWLILTRFLVPLAIAAVFVAQFVWPE